MQEKFLDSEILFENLDKLFLAIEKMDIETSLKILSFLVPEWESSKRIDELIKFMNLNHILISKDLFQIF